MKRNIKYVVFALIPVTFLLIAAEITQRILLEFPAGLYNILVETELGLYPENSEFNSFIGLVPYRIKTNSWGMRSHDITLQKPKDTIRIACIGDSATDGFYVDNEANYPNVLEEILRQSALTKSIEVMNGAKGGATIIGSPAKPYGQFERLVNVLTPLQPDIALLLFVTNDIYDLEEFSNSREYALQLANKYEGELQKYNKSPLEKIRDWILTKTAVGETLVSIKHPKLFKDYQRNKKIKLDDNRYNYDKTKENTATNNIQFNRKHGHADGLILKKTITRKTQELLDNYLFCLNLMNNFCQEKGIKLLFVYLPAYPQIYDSRASTMVKSILRQTCKKFNISFFDLTAALRSEGETKVLHFAPIDYHLNPQGNRVIAQAIADYLLESNLSH